MLLVPVKPSRTTRNVWTELNERNHASIAWAITECLVATPSIGIVNVAVSTTQVSLVKQLEMEPNYSHLLNQQLLKHRPQGTLKT